MFKFQTKLFNQRGEKKQLPAGNLEKYFSAREKAADGKM